MATIFSGDLASIKLGDQQLESTLAFRRCGGQQTLLLQDSDQLARCDALVAHDLDVARSNLNIGEARVGVDDRLVLLIETENVVAFLGRRRLRRDGGRSRARQ